MHHQRRLTFCRLLLGFLGLPCFFLTKLLRCNLNDLAVLLVVLRPSLNVPLFDWKLSEKLTLWLWLDLFWASNVRKIQGLSLWICLMRLEVLIYGFSFCFMRDFKLVMRLFSLQLSKDSRWAKELDSFFRLKELWRSFLDFFFVFFFFFFLKTLSINYRLLST